MVTVSWENCGPSCRGGFPAFLQSWRLSQHCYMETCGRGMLQRTRKAQVGQLTHAGPTRSVANLELLHIKKAPTFLTINLTKKFFSPFQLSLIRLLFMGTMNLTWPLLGCLVDSQANSMMPIITSYQRLQDFPLDTNSMCCFTISITGRWMYYLALFPSLQDLGGLLPWTRLSILK